MASRCCKNLREKSAGEKFLWGRGTEILTTTYTPRTMDRRCGGQVSDVLPIEPLGGYSSAARPIWIRHASVLLGRGW
jgi:hypothetical protein